jgi:hypothetical protein
MKSLIYVLTAGLVLLVLGGASARAGIVADFTSGNGNTLVDQYPGMAGDGWNTAWATAGGAFTSLPTVANTSPLNGGGNYLTARRDTTSTSAQKSAVYRQYSTFGSVDLTKAHRITFDYRVDVASYFNNSPDDYFQIYENNTADDFGGSGTWLVRAYGADTGTAKGSTWAAYSGVRDGGAFDINKFVDTGVPLSVGDVCTMTVDLDPAAGDWYLKIEYPDGAGGTSTYTSGKLGYRGNPVSVVADYITFGVKVKAVTGEPNNQEGFSADSIHITPEPATLALLGLGLGGMLLRRRSR